MSVEAKHNTTRDGRDGGANGIGLPSKSLVSWKSLVLGGGLFLAGCVSSGNTGPVQLASLDNGDLQTSQFPAQETAQLESAGDTSSASSTSAQVIPTRAPRTQSAGEQTQVAALSPQQAASVKPTALLSEETATNAPSAPQTQAAEKTAASTQVPAAPNVAAKEPDQEPTQVASLSTELPADTQAPQAADAAAPDATAPVVRSNKPKIVKPSTGSKKRKRTRVASLAPAKTNKPRIVRSGGGDALPGVNRRKSSLFGIGEERPAKRTKSGKRVKVASLGAFGRLSPNGLVKQHAGVKVSCFKPGLLRVLKAVERHYGKKVVVTSGYRSPRANRRAGGASRSKHITCEAADIQVPGVSKWALAKYLRSMPGRGGVGTYCRTKSVHVDIGSERDWHHKCRRSSLKRKT